MSKDIKSILSEVNRMNDLMMFSENREVLNESMASVLKSLRTLVKNGLDDIAKFGIKEVDNLARAMVNAKTADEFFEFLTDIKTYDSKIAKQLRRDIFDILPEVTQNRLKRITKQIEDNIDSIPEDKLDDLLDNILEGQFPNESESVKGYMKDALSDNSDIIANRMGMSGISDDIAGALDDLLSGARKTDPTFLDDIPEKAIIERMEQLSKSKPGKYQKHDIEFLERARNGKLPNKPSALDQKRIQEYAKDIADAALEQKNKWYKLNLRKDFDRLSNAKTFPDVLGSALAIGAKIGLPISLPIFILNYWEAFTSAWGKFIDYSFDVVLTDGFTDDWKEELISWYSTEYPEDNMDIDFYLEHQALIRVTGSDPNFEVSIYRPDGRTKQIVLKTNDNGESFTKVDL